MEGLILRSRVVPRRPHPYGLRNNRVRPQAIPQILMGLAIAAFGLAPQAPPARPRGQRRRREEDDEGEDPPRRRARVLTEDEQRLHDGNFLPGDVIFARIGKLPFLPAVVVPEEGGAYHRIKHVNSKSPHSRHTYRLCWLDGSYRHTWVGRTACAPFCAPPPGEAVGEEVQSNLQNFINTFRRNQKDRAALRVPRRLERVSREGIEEATILARLPTAARLNAIAAKLTPLPVDDEEWIHVGPDGQAPRPEPRPGPDPQPMDQEPPFEDQPRAASPPPPHCHSPPPPPPEAAPEEVEGIEDQPRAASPPPPHRHSPPPPPPEAAPEEVEGIEDQPRAASPPPPHRHSPPPPPPEAAPEEVEGIEDQPRAESPPPPNRHSPTPPPPPPEEAPVVERIEDQPRAESPPPPNRHSPSPPPPPLEEAPVVERIIEAEPAVFEDLEEMERQRAENARQDALFCQALWPGQGLVLAPYVPGSIRPPSRPNSPGGISNPPLSWTPSPPYSLFSPPPTPSPPPARGRGRGRGRRGRGGRRRGTRRR